MPDTPQDPTPLPNRLQRRDPETAPTPAEHRVLRPVAASGVAFGLALVAVAVATGHLWMVAPAAILVLLGGALFLRGVGDALLSSLPAGLATREPGRAYVGMGASIAADAVIEPGATVEMGATVGARARICRGAVVRMGSTIRAGAVIEEGAIVGWGVDVHEDAVVGKNAMVGAGCDIKAGARVPDGMRLMPGTDWNASATAASPPIDSTPAAPAIAAPTDPRVARIEAACARIESELAQASPELRALLGAPAETALSLRTTCLKLLERERELRAESSPEALALLDQERAAICARIDATDDSSVKQSLQSAVAAIDDQRSARGQLQKSADRLDAELTRLSWTLDGTGAQLVRLRSAGQDAAGAPDAAALQSMQQLHAEIDAIAQALEEVASGDRVPQRPALEPIVAVSNEPGASGRARERG